MSKIKCADCGTEIEVVTDCPPYCPTCNVSICPKCFHELKGDEETEICGYNCERCEWRHCGGCE